MTLAIGAAWRAVRDRFRARGLDTPELDARWLAEAAFGLEGGQLTFREGEAAAPEALERLEGFAARRLAGEPVARILGHKQFYGLDFVLNGATLVPRPETELLVDLGLKTLAGQAAPRFLDLGTGTGCIAIALLANLPQARGVAADLSGAALAAAAANARAHGVADRLDLRRGSWFGALEGLGRNAFDLIVANPPYIESAALAGLAREVRDHDPALALDGGPDGLMPYRVIAAGAAAWLKRDGMVIVEIGFDQGQAVKSLFEAAGFARVGIEKDLGGLDRVVIAHHF